MPTIFLDAGHSRKEAGAKANGLDEALLAIEIRDLVVQKLRGATGYNVFVIGDGLTLKETIANINDEAGKDDIAIALHFNANNNPDLKGVEAYYYKDSKVAECFTRNICAITGQVNRGARADTETFVGSLGFVRKLPCRSVLIECGYLTNGTEAWNLTDGAFKDKLATGIVNAILELEIEDKIYWLQQKLVALLQQFISQLQGKITK